MDAARCRQELDSLLARLPALLAPVFETTPMMAGGIYQRRFRCGQPTCHCASGSLHEYPSLATWGGPKKDVRRIRPEEDIERLRALTERYRAVRSARTSFLAWSRRVVKLIDALESARTRVPGPPKKSTARKAGGTK